MTPFHRALWEIVKELQKKHCWIFTDSGKEARRLSSAEPFVSVCAKHLIPLLKRDALQEPPKVRSEP